MGRISGSSIYVFRYRYRCGCGIVITCGAEPTCKRQSFYTCIFVYVLIPNSPGPGSPGLRGHAPTVALPTIRFRVMYSPNDHIYAYIHHAFRIPLRQPRFPVIISYYIIHIIHIISSIDHRYRYRLILAGMEVAPQIHIHILHMRAWHGIHIIIIGLG